MSERRNLPSASSLHRYAACPGSFLLEQTMPEEPSGPDAQMGNRIHAALNGETVNPPLTDEEERIAEACRIQEAALVSEVLGDTVDETVRECRMWAYDEDLKRTWSGKPDAIHILSSHALVIDYKTGRGEVTKATGNLQLRALAVLAHWEFGVSIATVAIIQPLAGPVSVCRYEYEDIRRAVSEIEELASRIRQPGQPRIPSADACKYCRAKAQCPEALKLAEEMPLQVTRDGREIIMSPERIAEFLDRVPAAEAVIEAVRAKAKRMIEADPQAIPGWTLKPGAARETITDPATLFTRFSDAGGTQEQFLPAVSVTKSRFKDAVKSATGEKGKALDALIESMLAGCTEAKPTAPSLVRVKEAA